MSLQPNDTAVLFIEFQNEFTTPGGKLHDPVKEVMASNNMLDNAREALDAAREKGALIIHAPIMFDALYPELPKEPYGILAGVKNGEAFKKGEWNADFHEKMKPAATDIVVEGKRGLCSFASTNLDFVLRQNGIRNLALAGFLTNCCVESTMRAAYEKGYNVFTLTDCCAATSLAAHNAAIEFTFPMFSHPVTYREFLEKLA